MLYVGLSISLVFIAITARFLLKQYNPHAVLIFSGLIMMVVAMAFGFNMPTLKSPTGSSVFDLFKIIKESFSTINSGVGLMIMAIGGFVAYMDHIGASDSLVNVAMRPLGLLKKHPNLAAVCVLPIGQILFVTIPSAAGLSLLLMASVFPILIGLGVSRIAAVSVITACTAFGIGPASAITASATQIADVDVISYFISEQLPLVWPSSLVMIISYFLVNRYFDKKDSEKEHTLDDLDLKKDEKTSVLAPRLYALLPVTPLILLIVFSELLELTPTPIHLDTTTAMIISLFVALLVEFIRKRNLKDMLSSLKVFWNGMGNIFKTVVTLIIAAEVFSKGLIALGFIDGLVQITENLGFGAVGIGIVLTAIIFLSSMLMGSGNAAFFAFAPLVPKIATKLGVKTSEIILPMNLSASMGRTVSPVAGIIIACSEIAGVSAFDIVKRNIIPLSASFLTMLLTHYL